MRIKNLLKPDVVHGTINSASGRVEVVSRNSQGASLPVSVGLSGLREMKGTAARIATTNNRAERRASGAMERKQGGSSVTTKRIATNIMLDALWEAPVQPRLLKHSHVDVLQVPKQQSIDMLFDASVYGKWVAVQEVLDEWANLEAGWDGEEAEPLSKVVLDAAQSFIEVAERYNVAEPRPFIGSDGEIGFIWDGERKASVSFTEADRFLAFCPRIGASDFRLAGPLDVAVCSPSLFESLREFTAA